MIGDRRKIGTLKIPTCDEWTADCAAKMFWTVAYPTCVVEPPFFGRVDGPLVAFSLLGDRLCRKLVGAGLLQEGWKSKVQRSDCSSAHSCRQPRRGSAIGIQRRTRPQMLRMVSLERVFDGHVHVIVDLTTELQRSPSPLAVGRRVKLLMFVQPTTVWKYRNSCRPMSCVHDLFMGTMKTGKPALSLSVHRC